MLCMGNTHPIITYLELLNVCWFLTHFYVLLDQIELQPCSLHPLLHLLFMNYTIIHWSHWNTLQRMQKRWKLIFFVYSAKNTNGFLLPRGVFQPTYKFCLYMMGCLLPSWWAVILSLPEPANCHVSATPHFFKSNLLLQIPQTLPPIVTFYRWILETSITITSSSLTLGAEGIYPVGKLKVFWEILNN